MKRLTKLILVMLQGLASGFASHPIQQQPLNAQTVLQIPVSQERLTTIRFPSPISDLEGAKVAAEPASDALFVISFRPGSAFFSVRALSSRAVTTVNVVWKEQTYVLELVESNDPWLSLVLTPPLSPGARGIDRPVTPTRLLGLLDTAKSYPLLRSQHPAAVAGIEVLRPNTMNDYGDYRITTEEIFRFDQADTLVFRVALSNQTSRTLHFLPQSFLVRVGDRSYHQSITDASGIMPPGVNVPVYFAITGTADGGRNELSPKNDFMILLQRVEAPAPAPRVSKAGPTESTFSVVCRPHSNAPPVRVSWSTSNPAPVAPQIHPVTQTAPTTKRWELSFLNFCIYYRHDD